MAELELAQWGNKVFNLCRKHNLKLNRSKKAMSSLKKESNSSRENRSYQNNSAALYQLS